MKLAYSTIACPNWKLAEIIGTARDFGFDGVEIRGVMSEMFAPAIPDFSSDEIEKTLAMLAANKISVSCVSSGACLAVSSGAEDAEWEAKGYIDIACKLGAKFVRVMPTDKPYSEGGDLECAAKIYQSLCEYGKTRGVTPLMESNGIFADTKTLKTFLDGIVSDNKGALWDINHPYRCNREKVAESVANLASYIKYVHVKDSVMNGGDIVYKMPGYGDFPIKEVVSELKAIGYDGYLTLEWVKRWQDKLDEPGVCIPLYSSYMKSLI